VPALTEGPAVYMCNSPFTAFNFGPLNGQPDKLLTSSVPTLFRTGPLSPLINHQEFRLGVLLERVPLTSSRNWAKLHPTKDDIFAAVRFCTRNAAVVPTRLFADGYPTHRWFPRPQRHSARLCLCACVLAQRRPHRTSNDLRLKVLALVAFRFHPGCATLRRARDAGLYS